MLLSRLLAQRQKGAVLVLSALAIPMLFATTGLAIDLGSAYLWHTSLQNAADAAALAGANALKNGDATSTVDRILLTSVTQNVKNDRDIAQVVRGTDTPADTDTVHLETAIDRTSQQKQTSRVVLRQKVPFHFLSLFGYPSIGISASAKAQYTETGEAGGAFDYVLFGGGRSSAYSSTTDTSRTGLRFRGAGVRLSGSIGTNGTIGLEVNDPSRGISFAAAPGSKTLPNVAICGGRDTSSPSSYIAGTGSMANFKGTVGKDYTVGSEPTIDISYSGTNSVTKKIWELVHSCQAKSLDAREAESIYIDVSDVNDTSCYNVNTDSSHRAPTYDFIPEYDTSKTARQHLSVYCNAGQYAATDNQREGHAFRVIIVDGNLNIQRPDNASMPDTGDDYAILISLHGNIRLQTGSNSSFRGFVYAPNGQIWIDAYSAVSGQFIGQQVIVDNNNYNVSKSIKFSETGGYIQARSSRVALVE